MDMDWTQAVTIIGTNLAVIFGFVIYMLGRMDNKFEQLLNRMDSNQKELEQKVESAQKDSNSKLERVLALMDSNHKELEQKMDSKFDAVNNRFNGIENRLTSLEAEAKNTSQRITDLKTDINQRLSNIENCIMPRKVFHFEESHHKDDHDEPKEN